MVFPEESEDPVTRLKSGVSKGRSSESAKSICQSIPTRRYFVGMYQFAREIKEPAYELYLHTGNSSSHQSQSSPLFKRRPYLSINRPLFDHFTFFVFFSATGQANLNFQTASPSIQ